MTNTNMITTRKETNTKGIAFIYTNKKIFIDVLFIQIKITGVLKQNDILKRILTRVYNNKKIPKNKIRASWAVLHRNNNLFFNISRYKSYNRGFAVRSDFSLVSAINWTGLLQWNTQNTLSTKLFAALKCLY